MWVNDMDKIFFPNLSSLKCVREGHNLKEHFIRLCKVNNSILWLPRCVCPPPTSSRPMCSTPAMCQALCNAHSPDLNAEEACQGQHIQVDTIDSSTQTCSAQSSPVQYNGSIPTKSAPHYFGFCSPYFSHPIHPWILVFFRWTLTSIWRPLCIPVAITITTVSGPGISPSCLSIYEWFHCFHSTL